MIRTLELSHSRARAGIGGALLTSALATLLAASAFVAAGAFLAAGALLAAGAFLAAGAATADEILLDGIAAQVGSEIVLVSEVEEVAAPIRARLRDAGAPPSEFARLDNTALERLIENKLIAGVVKRAELSAAPAEINLAIQGIAEEAGLTLDQLQRSVVSHGLTFEEYRSKIKAEVEKDKVLQGAVRSRVRVEPEEIEALFGKRYSNQPRSGEEFFLRHILVAFGAELFRNQDTACSMAAEGRARWAAGQISFSELVAEISDANRERRGDLGWVHESELASWMGPTVKALESGQVSEVIEMPFGCNLLEVVERRTYMPATLESKRPELQAELFGQKADREYVAWMEGLRDQIYIERKGKYAEVLDPSLRK